MVSDLDSVLIEMSGKGKWLRGRNEQFLGLLIKDRYFGELKEFNVEHGHATGHISFAVKVCFDAEAYGDDAARDAELMLNKVILQRVFDDLEVLS